MRPKVGHEDLAAPDTDRKWVTMVVVVGHPVSDRWWVESQATPLHKAPPPLHPPFVIIFN